MSSAARYLLVYFMLYPTTHHTEAFIGAWHVTVYKYTWSWGWRGWAMDILLLSLYRSVDLNIALWGWISWYSNYLESGWNEFKISRGPQTPWLVNFCQIGFAPEIRFLQSTWQSISRLHPYSAGPSTCQQIRGYRKNRSTMMANRFWTQLFERLSMGSRFEARP